MRLILSFALAGTLGILSACGGSEAAGDEPPSSAGSDRPRVVVTTNILGDVVAQTLGDQVVVEVVMPAGTDPHEFKPSARQAEAMLDADMVVTNGADLEQSLSGLIESARADGVPVFTFADHVELRHVADDPDGPVDPHLWTDPYRMATAVTALEDFAATVPGIDAAALAADTSFSDELDELDDEIAAAIGGIPTSRRVLVTNHESLGYFAERYGLRVVGAVIPSTSTSAGASAGDLEELAATIKLEGVRAIFAETTQPTRLAEALADEVGDNIAVVPLYTESLGEPGSGADTYVGMMRTNTKRIYQALS